MPTTARWAFLTAAVASGFFLFFHTLALTRAAVEHGADREAITAVLTSQQSAWNRGDVRAFLTGYWRSPELTFSGSSGVARGWDAVLARYKKNYPDRAAMGQLDFSNLEFRFLGPDAALVLGHWHLKREKDDLGGVFTLVWQRFPDGWKIIHDHTSAVVPPNANPCAASENFQNFFVAFEGRNQVGAGEFGAGPGEHVAGHGEAAVARGGAGGFHGFQ